MYAGRRPTADRELVSLARHRRKQLAAALDAADHRRHEREAIARELAELDAAIERGMNGELTPVQRQTLARRAREA